MPTYTSKGTGGDILLACAMPEAEYMYGCTPTAAAMLLGYYDLYGYRETDLSDIVEGDVELKSRGNDGDMVDMDAFDTVLGRLTASEDYVYRFHSRNGVETTPAQELVYAFRDDGTTLNTDIWNCLADYFGTGQYWRGNENLSTTDTQCSMEDLYSYNYAFSVSSGKTTRTIPYYMKTMLYGLDLYVQSRGYALDYEITGTFLVDVAGGDFTFADYMHEIDSGRPVLISINGHSMVGYGYNPDTKEIIFDDCYYADRRMAWDGTYEFNHTERALRSITVIGFNLNGDMDLAVSAIPGTDKTMIVSDSENAQETPDVCFAENTLYLSFAVSNLGSKESGDFRASVSFDNEPAGTSIPVESVPAQSERSLMNIPIGQLTIGLHNVRVTVDDPNEIQELTGTNNSAETSVLVLNSNTSTLSGSQRIENGETAGNIYVYGGALYVTGSASAVVLRGKNAGNGTSSWFQTGNLNVSRGGCVSGMAVCEYGNATIASGGTAVDIRIFSSGSILVSDGGTASDTIVMSDGRLAVSSGGKLTGRLELANTASASIRSGGILEFDLTSADPGAEAFVNDLSRLKGTPLYTITVPGKLTDGIYSLADGAGGFGQSISVVNTAGEELAVLRTGETASIGVADYTLNLNDGSLSLEVKTVQTFFAGDFAGTGQAMLARECGGTLTIYADGTSWGAGLGFEEGWSFAGVGDFNGDGKCDILRLHKSGLLVGELSNGDGTFTQTILDRRQPGWNVLDTGDFNGNGSDDVLAANPTGITGNVGLLGFWDSGTDWNTFAGYSGKWEQIATGDFDGNGSDDMLWRAEVTDENGTACYGYCSWLMGIPEGDENWQRIGALGIDEWDFLAAGDFSGDGTDDLAMIGPDGSVNICELEGGQLKNYSAEEREAGKSAWTQMGTADATEWTFAGVGDFNGDGTDDLAWCSKFTGEVQYWRIADKQIAGRHTIATIA